MSRPPQHRLDIYDAVLHLARSKAELKQIGSRLPGADLPKWQDALGHTTRVDWQPGKASARKIGVVHYAIVLDLPKLREDPRELVNVCAHEATHVAMDLLDHLEVSGPQNEAHAYLVGWLTAWLWQHATR